MKTIKRVAMAIATLLALSSPAIAEEGYIRIGDKCYTNATMPNGYGYLINVPCPRDLSENP